MERRKFVSPSRAVLCFPLTSHKKQGYRKKDTLKKMSKVENSGYGRKRLPRTKYALLHKGSPEAKKEENSQ